MPTKVFISYRRDDSKYPARGIYDAFRKVVPHENVFMDVDSIPPGANFRKVLKGWVDECEVLLALIGSGWIDATDPKTGQRRLDNPSDFVRIEISEALARDIPVVPVLLDGAPMPDVDLLPDEMKELVDRQAEFVVHRTFNSDVERLIKKLGLGHGAGPAAPPGGNTETSSAPDEFRTSAEERVNPWGSEQVRWIKAGAGTDPPSSASRSDPPAKGSLGLFGGLSASRSGPWRGRIKVDAKIIQGAPDGWFKPGAGRAEWFKDYELGPEMVVVPAGEFIMGSPWKEEEKPEHKVSIRKPLAVGRFAVTFAEWDAADLSYKPGDQGWGRGRRPVISVSWEDAKSYAVWLAQKTGKEYRLLSEAEWEYCCRAGTITKYAFGDNITRQQAQFSEGESGSAKQTVEVGKFPSNAWGLHDMHGNVWEWCEDNWHGDYKGAPQDGSVWQGGDAPLRVRRGGSWDYRPISLRSAYRLWYPPDGRIDYLGFRLARTL